MGPVLKLPCRFPYHSSPLRARAGGFGCGGELLARLKEEMLKPRGDPAPLAQRWIWCAYFGLE